MKFIALSALIATAFAALGDDCYYDASVCDSDGLKCATWNDSQYGDMASCEDCKEGSNRVITDSYGDPVTYECPYVAPEPTEDDGEGETEEPAPEERNPTQ